MEDIHHAAANGYTARAETYAHGRPEYPAALDQWLRDTLSLGPGKRVADLGAGTGKFSAKLLTTGAEVLPIEPVPAMLEQLKARLPGIAALRGTAESIPLPDASVDAVICAQSFHWFATPQTLAEIHRILKPRGSLGLVWNVRDETIPWVAALSALIEPFSGDAPRYRTQAWRSIFPAPGFTALAEQHFPHAHTGPPEQVIVDRTLSVSFIAALPASEQQQLAAQVRQLIAQTPELANHNTVSFPYNTIALHCAKLL